MVEFDVGSEKVISEFLRHVSGVGKSAVSARHGADDAAGEAACFHERAASGVASFSGERAAAGEAMFGHSPEARALSLHEGCEFYHMEAGDLEAAAAEYFPLWVGAGEEDPELLFVEGPGVDFNTSGAEKFAALPTAARGVYVSSVSR